MSFLLSDSRPGFVSPGASDFVYKPIINGIELTTKPILLIFFSVFLISTFFIFSSRRALVVPTKLQFVGESVYSFVRNDIGKDVIGHDFQKFVPFLFAIFTFVLTNNLFGIIPLIQFPTMSHIGFPVALTLFVYFVFHTVAIKKHGLIKYLKDKIGRAHV